MTKKNRSIILLICTVLFFIIAPYIVLYSIGYRVDFKKLKIVATGGIYVRALPQGVSIIIDSKINNKTGLFLNYVFVQDLLPKQHTVVIKKDGYYDYQKNLEVKERSVTKLEHVILIKQNIPFDSLENNINYFYITPNGNNILLVKINNFAKQINFETINLLNDQKLNLSLSVQGKAISDLKWSDDSNKALLNIEGNYFLMQPFLQKPEITALPFLYGAKRVSFNPRNANQIFFIKNKNLYANTQFPPVIKNIVAYQVTNNTITWLSSDGFLYNAGVATPVPNKISLSPFLVKNTNDYKIIINSEIVALQENESLFLLNPKSKIFENFYGSVKNIKVSPDEQKILYYNDHEILYSLTNSLNQDPLLQADKIFLNRFSEKINDCYWLGSDYLIFNLEGKIVISEIDIRDNVNTVQLPQILSLPGRKTINVNELKIYFNQQDKKLYILSGNNFVSSERLIP